MFSEGGVHIIMVLWNVGEIMVDRMKDEIVDLKEQNDELLEEQR